MYNSHFVIPNTKYQESLSMYEYEYIFCSVCHPKSGRVLEVYSDQPGVQFYTSNYMPDPNNRVNFLIVDKDKT